MVKQDTRGLRDWLAQRVTAVLIGAYAIYLLAYLLSYNPIYYAQWQELFNCFWMQIATFIVLLSILWHAWVGLWTVFTDYLKHKPTRLLLQTLVIILFAGYVGWVIRLLWS